MVSPDEQVQHRLHVEENCGYLLTGLPRTPFFITHE